MHMHISAKQFQDVPLQSMVRTACISRCRLDDLDRRVRVFQSVVQPCRCGLCYCLPYSPAYHILVSIGACRAAASLYMCLALLVDTDCKHSEYGFFSAFSGYDEVAE